VETGVTDISFNTATGDLSFQTSDFDRFPYGTYEFELTITVGSESQTVTVHVHMHQTCHDYVLTVVEQPPSITHYYTFGESEQTIWNFNFNQIVTSVPGGCGVPTVGLVDENGSPVAVIFMVDCQSNGLCSISVFADSVQWVGEYSVQI
jgi:hypothetical protein